MRLSSNKKKRVESFKFVGAASKVRFLPQLPYPAAPASNAWVVELVYTFGLSPNARCGLRVRISPQVFTGN